VSRWPSPCGALSPRLRANGWQVAEAVGDATPDPMPRRLARIDGRSMPPGTTGRLSGASPWVTRRGSAAWTRPGPLDQRFSLPEAWSNDPVRQAKAKGPGRDQLFDQATARHRPAGARLGTGGAEALGDWGGAAMRLAVPLALVARGLRAEFTRRHLGP
jgi:hypothetical protein